MEKQKNNNKENIYRKTGYKAGLSVYRILKKGNLNKKLRIQITISNF